MPGAGPGWRSDGRRACPRPRKSTRPSEAPMRGLSPTLAQGLIILGLVGLLGLLAWSARRGRPDAGPGGLLIRHSAAFRMSALLTALAVPIGITLAFAVFPPLREEARYAL